MFRCLGFRVWVQGLGFRVWGSGFWCLGFRCSGVWVFRCSGVWVFGCLGVQVFWCVGVQVSGVWMKMVWDESVIG